MNCTLFPDFVVMLGYLWYLVVAGGRSGSKATWLGGRTLAGSTLLLSRPFFLWSDWNMGVITPLKSQVCEW